MHELLLGQGSTFTNGPANYYRVAGNPQDLAETTSQVFLGVRLQCAECHHHPFEKWSQADYYQFAAFFARVGQKNSGDFGLFGNETVVKIQDGGEVYHPKTGALMRPDAARSDALPRCPRARSRPIRMPAATEGWRSRIGSRAATTVCFRGI